MQAIQTNNSTLNLKTIDSIENPSLLLNNSSRNNKESQIQEREAVMDNTSPALSDNDIFLSMYLMGANQNALINRNMQTIRDETQSNLEQQNNVSQKRMTTASHSHLARVLTNVGVAVTRGVIGGVIGAKRLKAHQGNCEEYLTHNRSVETEHYKFPSHLKDTMPEVSKYYDLKDKHGKLFEEIKHKNLLEKANPESLKGINKNISRIDGKIERIKQRPADPTASISKLQAERDTLTAQSKSITEYLENHKSLDKAATTINYRMAQKNKELAGLGIKLEIGEKGLHLITDLGSELSNEFIDYGEKAADAEKEQAERMITNSMQKLEELKRNTQGLLSKNEDLLQASATFSLNFG